MEGSHCCPEAACPRPLSHSPAEQMQSDHGPESTAACREAYKYPHLRQGHQSSVVMCLLYMRGQGVMDA